MEEPRPELIDYLYVVWRWRRLIALGAIAGLLGAAVVTWTVPKTYRIHAAIDTGDLSDAGARDVERLVARVNAGPGLRAGSASERVHRLSAEFKRPVLVELYLETEAPEPGTGLVRQTAGAMVDELNRILRAEQEDRGVVERRTEELRRLLERLRRAQDATLRRVDDPAAALMFSRLSDEVAGKEHALRDLERRIEVWRARPAALVVEPELPRVPIRPRWALNLPLGLILGLLMSGSSAFLIEYIDRAKARRRSAQRCTDDLAKNGRA